MDPDTTKPSGTWRPGAHALKSLLSTDSELILFFTIKKLSNIA